MPTFSTTQPSLRARVLPKFPAQILAGNGITITRQGAAYVFAVTAAIENIPLSALAAQPGNTIVGRGPGPAGPPQALNVGGGLIVSGGNSIEMTPNQRARGVMTEFTLPSVGSVHHIVSPISCKITKIVLLGNQPTGGNIEIDLWRNTFASWIQPLSICGGVFPAMVAPQTKVEFSNFATWNVNIDAHDIVTVQVRVITGHTVFVVSIEVEAT